MVTSEIPEKREGSAIEADLMRPVRRIGPGGRVWIGSLILVCLWGIYAYSRQLRFGLGQTAMRDYVSWGLYISTFVFFSGLTQAGTLVSAVLRVTHAHWRQPITRMAEIITFSALVFTGLMPIIDMGRPDRIPYLLLFGRVQSPLIWDIVCIATYLVGSGLYLYIPLVPDIARCRDTFTDAPRWRRKLYSILSLNWRGNTVQWKTLEKCLAVMAAVIIPVGISVHTVVSFIFALTLRPGWNSTIFGPYFVAGAFMSGAAAVVIIMAVVRKSLHLEKYITVVQFKNMALVVFAMALVYLYFNLNEYWIPGYKMSGTHGAEGNLLHSLFGGKFALVYWTTQIAGLLIPIALLGFPRVRRNIPLTVTACFLLVAGSWVKRYIIVVPSLMSPFLPIQSVPLRWSHYFPNWVEWSVTMGAIAGFLLLYTLIARLFPVISIWEVEKEMHAAHHRAGSPEKPEEAAGITAKSFPAVAGNPGAVGGRENRS
jgi:Ni/Fe-hydrogenase subunit HybB-like protein